MQDLFEDIPADLLRNSNKRIATEFSDYSELANFRSKSSEFTRAREEFETASRRGVVTDRQIEYVIRKTRDAIQAALPLRNRVEAAGKSTEDLDAVIKAYTSVESIARCTHPHVVAQLSYAVSVPPTKKPNPVRDVLDNFPPPSTWRISKRNVSIDFRTLSGLRKFKKAADEFNTVKAKLLATRKSHAEDSSTLLDALTDRARKAREAAETLRKQALAENSGHPSIKDIDVMIRAYESVGTIDRENRPRHNLPPGSSVAPAFHPSAHLSPIPQPSTSAPPSRRPLPQSAFKKRPRSQRPVIHNPHTPAFESPLQKTRAIAPNPTSAYTDGHLPAAREPTQPWQQNPPPPAGGSQQFRPSPANTTAQPYEPGHDTWPTGSSGTPYAPGDPVSPYGTDGHPLTDPPGVSSTTISTPYQPRAVFPSPTARSTHPHSSSPAVPPPRRTKKLFF